MRSREGARGARRANGTSRRSPGGTRERSARDHDLLPRSRGARRVVNCVARTDIGGGKVSPPDPKVRLCTRSWCVRAREMRQKPRPFPPVPCRAFRARCRRQVPRGSRGPYLVARAFGKLDATLGNARPRDAREESPRPIPREGSGRDEHPVRRRRPGRLLPNPSPSRTHKLTRSLLSARLARAMTRNCRPRHERRDERGPSSTARRAAAVDNFRPPLHSRRGGARRGARPPGRSPVRRPVVRQVPRAEADALPHARPETLARPIRRLRVRAVLPRCAGVGSVPMWKVDGRRRHRTNGPAGVGGDDGDESSRDENRGVRLETRGRGRGRGRETRGRETRRFTRAGEESTAHAAVWLGETHRRAPRDGA